MLGLVSRTILHKGTSFIHQLSLKYIQLCVNYLPMPYSTYLYFGSWTALKRTIVVNNLKL